MMLCPVNVVLKLNRLVNVSCSFNIRGEYFKARYFNNYNNNNNNNNYNKNKTLFIDLKKNRLFTDSRI